MKRLTLTAVSAILACLTALPSLAWTVYLDNSKLGWSEINVWAWNDDGNCVEGIWPGPEMTLLSGNVYAFSDFTDEPTGIIFSCNNTKLGGGNLVYGEGFIYLSDGSSALYDPASYTEENGLADLPYYCLYGSQWSTWSEPYGKTYFAADDGTITFTASHWAEGAEFKVVYVDPSSATPMTWLGVDAASATLPCGGTVALGGSANMKLPSSANNKTVTITFDKDANTVRADWDEDAKAYYALRGSMWGAWTEDYGATSDIVDGVVTFNVPLWESGAEFKVVYVDESGSMVWYGRPDAVIGNGESATLTTNSSNDNVSLSDAASGRQVTLKLNVASWELAASWIEAGPEPTGTLPVLYINVYTDDTKTIFDNEVIDKDLAHKNYFSYADYWLDMKDCQWMKDLGIEGVGSEESPLPLEIKARGNATRVGFSKKPYKIKLAKKQNLLGLTPDKSKHYALLAHADDSHGYLRNYVGFRLGEMIGLPWTPSQQPLEVVINGDYRGIYFLTESIRVGDGRVDINELADECDDRNVVSGGYLIELDNYIDEAVVVLNDPSNKNQYPMDGEGHTYGDIMVTPNTPEIYSPLQLQFVTDQFTKMNSLVNSSDDSELWSYLDLDDAARYYLVEEILSHYESYHGSTYMFRDRGEGQKWHFSPLWDCGHAFEGPSQGYFYENSSYGNSWVGNVPGTGLVSKEKFMDKVKATFQWFINMDVTLGCTPYQQLLAEIDEYVAHVKAAAYRDFDRWDGQPLPSNTGGFVCSAVTDNRDIESYDKDEVKNFLNTKITWLKQQWGTTTEKTPEPERDTTPAADVPEWALPEPMSVTGMSGTLPLVQVTWEGEAAVGFGDEGIIEGASVRIMGLESGAADMDAVATSIKGRGDDWSDATGAKNSYKLKLAVKTAVLGMPASKHFVLQAFPADAANGLLTNYAGHRLAEAIGMSWTPSMVPVELALNNDYKGLYWLMEDVRSDADRVAISEDNPKKGKFTDDSDWIVEFDHMALPEELNGFILADDGVTMSYMAKAEYPDFTDYTDDVAADLGTKLNTALAALGTAMDSAAADTAADSWTALVDAGQAARWYILQELMDCRDGVRTDFYAHRLAGVWQFGPVWNFTSSAIDCSDAGAVKQSLIAERPIIDKLYANIPFFNTLVQTFNRFVYGVEIALPANGMRHAVTSGYGTDFATALADVEAMGASLQAAADADAAVNPGCAATSAAMPVAQRAQALTQAIRDNAAYLSLPVAESGAGWNAGKNTAIPTLTADDLAQAEWFDLTGRRVDTPVAGRLYIVRQDSHAAKRIAR